jgi:hypothetical protein
MIIKTEQISSHGNEDSPTLASRQSSTHPALDTSRPEQTLRSSSTPSEQTINQTPSYEKHKDSMSLQYDWSSQPIFRALSPKFALISPSQATEEGLFQAKQNLDQHHMNNFARSNDQKRQTSHLYHAPSMLDAV